MTDAPARSAPSVLFVEADILVRSAIAAYLRDCGYLVIEATSTDEAVLVLQEAGIDIDIVFVDMDTPGQRDGFGLSQWTKEHRPGVDVVLAGTLQRAAQLAGDLCERGPHLRKPYEPGALVDWIKRLRARR